MDILRYLLTNPLELGLIWAIFGLGVFISYRVLDIADLSVESVLPFSAIVTILAINMGIHPILAMVLSAISGIFLGVITACLSTILKLPPLLSGIVMMTALISFITVLSNGNLVLDSSKSTIFTSTTNLFKDWTNSTFWGNFIGITLILLLTLAVICGLMYWFFGTKLGVAIRASGQNKMFARSQGINVNLMTIIGMAIASCLIAIAGSLLGQFNGSVASTTGKGSIVIGLAVVFLGEVFFNPKTFKTNIIAVVVGGYVYWLVMALILSIKGFNTSYTYLVQACLIVLVMVIPELISYIRQKNSQKRRYQNAQIK